jgi:hypothetical protein
LKRAWLAALPGAQQAAVGCAHRLAEETGVGDGDLGVVVALQQPACFGEGAQHKAVPGSEDLVVKAGPDALSPFLIEPLPRLRQQLRCFVDVQA